MSKILAASLLLTHCLLACPQDEEQNVEVTAPLAKIMKGSNRGAAYGTFKNTSKKLLKLIGFSAQGIKNPELHQHVEKDGKMRMEAVSEIVLEPDHEVKLIPGGLHLMFDADPEAFKDVKEIELTLKLADSEGKICEMKKNFTLKAPDTE